MVLKLVLLVKKYWVIRKKKHFFGEIKKLKSTAPTFSLEHNADDSCDGLFLRGSLKIVPL